MVSHPIKKVLILTGSTYGVDEHVALQFGVVQESLVAPLKVASEKFVTVHGHVLLK
jgi:hypothetical protein